VRTRLSGGQPSTDLDRVSTAGTIVVQATTDLLGWCGEAQRLTLRDCTWHYHGVLEPPDGAEVSVELTSGAAVEPGGRLLGHGVRGGQAMIATLRHRLIRVPARLIRHATASNCVYPEHDLLSEVLTRIRALPTTSRPGARRPQTSGTRQPEATLGSASCPRTRSNQEDQQKRKKDLRAATRGIGSDSLGRPTDRLMDHSG
jgi:hypothetical protein